MNIDKVMALWSQSFDDSEGIRQGYTAQQLFFAALLQREMEAENAIMLKALHEISLCSQNSMSSKSECGRIARAAIDRARSANDT